MILAIETSCDDTCAAVLDGPRILSNLISSQDEAHAVFGGIVPEVASRHHLELAVPVIGAALSEAGVSLDRIDSVAVTAGPGLIGALLVGLSTAKAIAAPRRLPLIPVDHLQGHVAANFLAPEPLEPPFLCLVASGGHTLLAAVRDHHGHEVLGQTLDDAAGEAFDKVAKLLGLGYPGGPVIDRLSKGANDRAVEFTVARIKDGASDFSFSGLKTAVLYHVRREGIAPLARPDAEVPPVIRDLVASFQRAVVTALLARLKAAALARRPRSLILTGGVAANTLLRAEALRTAESVGVPLFVPSIALSTDNAAMIGAAGFVAYTQGRRAGWDLNAEPNLPLV